MNQHLRAVAMTAGMIVIVLATTSCIFLIYTVFLAQIRYEDSLKRMVDKK
jgi:hypothetical protein